MDEDRADPAKADTTVSANEETTVPSEGRAVPIDIQARIRQQLEAIMDKQAVSEKKFSASQKTETVNQPKGKNGPKNAKGKTVKDPKQPSKSSNKSVSLNLIIDYFPDLNV